MSTGLLIIRVVVGFLLVGHGLQKVAGWFDGPGIAGTTAGFHHLGFHPARLMAWLAALGELGSGLSLGFGFLTPVGAAALVGVMVNAAAVHWPNGLWITKQGWEYTLVLAGVGAGLAFTGPGRFSIDHVLGWDWTSPWWGWGAVLAGLVSGAATLVRRRLVLRRPDPSRQS